MYRRADLRTTRLVGAMVAGIMLGCGGAPEPPVDCMNLGDAVGPLVTTAALLRVDIYGPTAACAGNTVAAGNTPLVSRTFSPNEPIALDVSPGVHTVVLTTFADGAGNVVLGEACTSRTAYRIVEERWAAHVASLLMRVQFSRVNMLDLRARSAVAAAAQADGSERGRYLRRAARDAAALAREHVPWAEAMGLNVAAAVAAAANDDNAAVLYERAASVFERADMTLFAAAARRRRGALVGGDAGRALVDDAERFMRSRSVADRAALSAMLSPIATR